MKQFGHELDLGQAEKSAPQNCSRRQLYREHTPLPQFRPDVDFAAVGMDDFAGEAEADARAAFFGGVKRHENLLQNLGFDARAVVSDGKLQLLSFLCSLD